MVQSKAATVDEYLRELPSDRRAVLTRVREIVVQNLPKGFRESMNWGMITYEIPLERYGDTYNGQPLCYIGLAAQKRHFSLYLMGVAQSSEKEKWLRSAFKQAGKDLDMGKSCLRFRTLDDLPLEVIGQVVASTTPEDLIAQNEIAHPR